MESSTTGAQDVKGIQEIHEIREILGMYELGQPLSLERLHSGFANLSYRLETDTGTFLFRICTEKSDDEIEYELRILRKLKENNFPAAYPIARRDEEYISHHGKGHIVIYDFIHGGQPECTGETVREIARAVAHLNSMKEWEPLKKGNALDLQLCQTVISQYPHAPNHYPGTFDYFRKETEYLSGPLQENIPCGLIHGDVFPDNTIFRDNQLQAIIDWEEACTDRLLIDVGVAINGFCFPKNRLDDKLLDVFLKHYESIRKLSVKERELLPFYIRWGAHAMIAWHLKHLIYVKDPRKIDRVTMFMERLKRLPR